ncbi:hypothetical protein H5410_036863 [Solanum commersonii]|uniref:Uncharacterized protein n=1 Tax=Solanum commersonii TaxID=4109 RepID=A0A9J5Y6V7_SOLCO|nr:hypothetical protein H5410_036863 [Solanum commersonii]
MPTMTRKKRQSRAPPPLEPESPKSIGTSERHVTPATRILQALEPLQLSSWISGKESALSILGEMTKSITLTPHDAEIGVSTAAQKLTYSTKKAEETSIMSEVVRGNKLNAMGLALDYYPPVVNDGHKVAKHNSKYIQEESQKLMVSMIGYVVGGNPTFKDMLKFVYGV